MKNIFIVILFLNVIHGECANEKSFFLKLPDGLYFFQMNRGVPADEDMDDIYKSNYNFRPLFLVSKGKPEDPYELLRKKGVKEFHDYLLYGKKFYIFDDRKKIGIIKDVKCFDSIPFEEINYSLDYYKCSGCIEGDTNEIGHVDTSYNYETDEMIFRADEKLLAFPSDVETFENSTFNRTNVKKMYDVKLPIVKKIFKDSATIKNIFRSTTASMSVKYDFRSIKFEGLTFLKNKKSIELVSIISVKTYVNENKLGYPWYILIVTEGDTIKIIDSFMSYNTGKVFTYLEPQINSTFDIDGNGISEIIVGIANNVSENGYKIDIYSLQKSWLPVITIKVR